MSVFCINYDLSFPGRNYDSLYDALKKMEGCRILESCWVVSSNENAIDIRDRLKRLMDSNDKLFVARLSGNWAANFGNECLDWVKSIFP